MDKNSPDALVCRSSIAMVTKQGVHLFDACQCAVEAAQSIGAEVIFVFAGTAVSVLPSDEADAVYKNHPITKRAISV